MIFVVSILALFSICRGDVSHLDTDLRDDGYHYKQPYKPFPSEKNELDGQLNPDTSQQKLGPRTQAINTAAAKPTAEYLPPDEDQTASQPPSSPKFPTQPTLPTMDYGPPSTFMRQTPAEPTKEYGRPTSFVPQSPPSAYPQRPTGKTSEQYGPPLATSPQTTVPRQRPSTSAPVQVPQQPGISLAPKREYLPPGDNKVNAGQDVFPNKEKTSMTQFPVQPPTLPVPKSTKKKFPVTPEQRVSYQTPKPTYIGPEPTNKVLQSNYPGPTSTYSASQPTYPEPQYSPTDETGPQLIGPKSEESDLSHDLGPDGYNYKIPSNKFRY